MVEVLLLLFFINNMFFVLAALLLLVVLVLLTTSVLKQREVPATVSSGSAVGLKVSARCSDAIRIRGDGWISCEPQLCCCIADVRGVL